MSPINDHVIDFIITAKSIPLNGKQRVGIFCMLILLL